MASVLEELSAPASRAEPHRSLDGVLGEDARALRRGVAANLVGYVLAALQPPLFVLVVRAYGAESFGAFSAANALSWLALRLSVLGLDKGLLWWVARADAAGAQSAIRSSIVWVLGASLVTAAGVAGPLAAWLSSWAGLPQAEPMLRLMALGLVPMSLTELLLAIGLGQRRVRSKVFVRDGLLPLSQAGVALCAHAVGLSDTRGLALAFVVSHTSCLVACLLLARQRLVPRRWTWPEPLPAELVRYTRAAFGAELVGSLSLRIDVVVVAALTDPRTLGIWAAVMQVGNLVRSIRRSFDPIVMATFAKIGALPERRRLVRSFSHATSLVLSWQTPVLLFLMAFAEPVLGLFGSGFENGAGAVVLLCLFWFASGLLGLNGFVVAGFGRSDWLLIDVSLATLAQAGALFVLVPRFGLLGAACAVGGSHLLLCGLQAAQARRVAGTWAYDPRVWRALGLGLLAMATLLLIRGGLGARPVGRSAAAYAAAMLLFGALFLYQRRAASDRTTDGA